LLYTAMKKQTLTEIKTLSLAVMITQSLAVTQGR
jgi:hypothetical protein